MTPEFFCLHGFLGTPADWETALPAADGRGAVRSADWLRDPGMRGMPGMPGMKEEWDLNALAEAVNRWAAERSSANISRNASRRILIGYSMGGRIALHALLKNPSLWDRAVIISAHPGLASESERRVRLGQDQEWARRFRSEEWEPLLDAWNSQAVFSGEPGPFARPETPGLREALARALENGSLAKQRDLRKDLAHLSVPILWMAGEKDVKYAALARECAALNSGFRFAGIAGAGHRAPWTANRAFQEILGQWTDNFTINHPTEAAL